MCKKELISLKKTVLILLLLFGCVSISAQDKPIKSDFWQHVRFGGSAGLGFSNGTFNGSIAPSAIYQFNEKFGLGTSLSLSYAKYENSKFLAYGGSLLSAYNPIPQIQLSAEIEQLRINRTLGTTSNNIEENYWSPALFLGAGYSMQNLTVGIRYDVLYNDQKSIYTNAWLPFVRFYF